MVVGVVRQGTPLAAWPPLTVRRLAAGGAASPWQTGGAGGDGSGDLAGWRVLPPPRRSVRCAVHHRRHCQWLGHRRRVARGPFSARCEPKRPRVSTTTSAPFPSTTTSTTSPAWATGRVTEGGRRWPARGFAEGRGRRAAIQVCCGRPEAPSLPLTGDAAGAGADAAVAVAVVTGDAALAWGTAGMQNLRRQR